MTPADVLRHYWGYDSFRECQAEIIGSVLAGTDTIGLLPTGGGKSVTFQIPAMIMPGITLVVTPLISLMKDQVDNLRSRGIPAACLHSAMSYHETNLTFDRLHIGKIKILYLSPEKLARDEFLMRISPLDVDLIVVDEAHCISQWGYDFRPSYLKINRLREIFKGAVMMALTATATPAVVSDIANRLDMHSPAIFSRSFSRNNISYIVRHTSSKDNTLIHVLSHTSGPSIVYTRSRRRTVEIAEMLNRAGFKANFYHAGLEGHLKNERQDDWMAGNTRIIVATNAFGMGIDKPDVRLVIHYDIPSSLEEYYQEAGRAGRDGLEAYAVLLATSTDKAVLKKRLLDQYPSRETIRDIYDKTCVFLDLAMGEGYKKFFEFNIIAFSRLYSLKPRIVASALNILTRAGIIDFNEELDSRSRAMFLIRRDEFYNLDIPDNAELIIRAMMRLYSGLFADYVRINETELSYETSLPEEEIYETFLMLSRMHVLSYIPKRNLPGIYFPYDRQESRHIIIPRDVYEIQLEHATRRMEAMRDYVFGHEECRVKGMLEYFGEINAQPCGKCDICRDTKRAANSATRQAKLMSQIEKYFETERTISISDIKARWITNAHEVIDILRSKVEDGHLAIDGDTFCLRHKKQ